jgi:cytochrome c-type biogenesis protein
MLILISENILAYASLANVTNAKPVSTATTATTGVQPNSQEIKPAPKYSAMTLDGKPAPLEEFRGNPAIVNVWATWCIPCRQEMPALEALYNKYSSQGLQIVGVSIDGPGTTQRIKSFIDRMEITYNILHDPDDKFSRAFRTIGVPESFLINAKGEIVHTWKGPFDAMSEDTQARVTNLLVDEANGQVGLGEPASPGSESQNQNQTSSQPQASQNLPTEDDTYGAASTPDSESSPNTTNYQLIAYPIAFGAGILSFLSPCILPLIPSFVAFVTGMSIEELTGKNNGKNKRREDKNGIKNGSVENDQKSASQASIYSSESMRSSSSSSSLSSDSTGLAEASEQSSSPSISSSSSSYPQFSTKHTALVRGLLFIAGFSIVFVALGASITAIGSLFFDYSRWIEIIGGILLVGFGLNLLGILRIPGSEREWKFHFSKRPIAGHVGSLVIGMGFGAGWTPCIGPILASILAIAASGTSLTTGVMLLAVYSAGLAVPFIISTMAVEKFITAFKQIRRWLPWINRTSAALLIIVGIMLLTGFLTTLTGTLTGLGMPLNLG